MKQSDQGALFRLKDASGNLKPNIDPFAHQLSRSNAQSRLSYEKYKASGFHIVDKLRIKVFLFANQGSTLNEISAGTGIVQKGVITARFKNLRKDGFDLPNDHGRWSIHKRIEK